MNEHDLEWLKSRSRQTSNQNGRSISQKPSRPVDSVLTNKRREPTIFDLNNEDDN